MPIEYFLNVRTYVPKAMVFWLYFKVRAVPVTVAAPVLQAVLLKVRAVAIAKILAKARTSLKTYFKTYFKMDSSIPKIIIKYLVSNVRYISKLLGFLY